MNYGSVRFYLRLRYLKAADGDGAGGGGSSPPSDGGSVSPGGDGGGGSSVATPSSDGGASSQNTPPSPDTNSDPWANLGSMEDLDHIEVPPQAPPQPTPTPQSQVPPSQPQTPPQAAPQVAPQAPQPQAPQPGAPTQPIQDPQAPQVELSPSDPAGMAAAMEENAPALIQHLAQTRFALTQEEVQELQEDAAVAVPKLLAKVHLHAQIAMQKFLAQAVPGMIQQHQRVSTANSEAENKFFETHKALGLDKNNKQHRDTAIRIAKLYRGQNPTAPLDQLISDIGHMVAKAVGAQPGQPQPGAPSAAQVPGTVMVGQTAFRPAVNGGGAPPMTPPAAGDNQWAGLGQDYD